MVGSWGLLTSAAQLLSLSQQVSKGEHGPLAMGVEGTQPAQHAEICQTRSVCLGDVQTSLQSSSEKEEDFFSPVLPGAKVVGVGGSLSPTLASSGAGDSVLCFPGGPSGKEPACQCRRCKRCGLDP